MRVHAVVPLYPPTSPVGAWITTHEFLRHLTTRGHTVTAQTYVGSTASYEIDGVTVHPRRVTLADTPDLVVHHATDSGRGLRVHPQVPHVALAHSAPNHVRPVTLTVYNSHALQAHVGAPGVVIHPPVDPDRYRTTPGTRVTLVNCSEPKGGRIFDTLARHMPDVDFLAVPGHYGAQVRYRRPNIMNVGTTQDMRDVYSQTRILLCPSSVEWWGRVGIEAMSSGIPVIASKAPGLLESLGTAGTFVDRADIEGWKTEIRRLLEPAEWQQASLKALSRVAELDPAGDLDRFADAVEQVVQFAAFRPRHVAGLPA